MINSKTVDELLGLSNKSAEKIILTCIPWTKDRFNSHFQRLDNDGSYDMTETGFELFIDAAKSNHIIGDSHDQTVDDILIEFATEQQMTKPHQKTVTEIKNHTFAFHDIRVFETANGNYIALPDITDILSVKVDAALQYQLSDIDQLHDFDCGDDVDVIPLDMAVIEILLAKSKSPRVLVFREFLLTNVLPKHQPKNATTIVHSIAKRLPTYLPYHASGHVHYATGRLHIERVALIEH